MSHRRPIRSGLAVSACAAAVFGAFAAPAQAAPAPASAVNLLHNAGAETGAASVHGWDAVTIPGWSVAAGLPTVVRYGDRGFPEGARPGVRRGRGRARRAWSQTSLLARPGGGPLAAGTRYALSAELGGTTTSRAGVAVAFLSPSGRVLAGARWRPVGRSAALGRERAGARSLSGRLPRAVARARVTLMLATSLTNFDGPNAPLVGFDRAVADDIGFVVLAPPPPRGAAAAARRCACPATTTCSCSTSRTRTSTPSSATRRQAPYLNSLLPQGSQLGDFFAEEHPSATATTWRWPAAARSGSR